MEANRAWNKTGAIEFASSFSKDSGDASLLDQIEFIEEPIRPQNSEKGDISNHIKLLEGLHDKTCIKYAFDESLHDLAMREHFNFTSCSIKLKNALEQHKQQGCAALVLKPSLLGFEFSMRLARFARQNLGLGAVFTSCFDTGLGLSHIAFLASISDSIPFGAKFAHGLGTFEFLNNDILSPSFESYVKRDGGVLKVSSLGRALYGLRLEELNESLQEPSDTTQFPYKKEILLDSIVDGKYNQPLIKKSIINSSSGREIRVKTTLFLPFLDDLAYSCFTDLPQQS
jgi:hypothetical protein